MRRRPIAMVLALLLVAGHPRPADAYLKLGFQFGGGQLVLKWSRMPVRYFVTNRGIPGVSATEFQAVVARAFATWEAVPTSSISYTFGGFTTSLPGEDDGRSTLGFLNQPDLDRVLASTSFLVDDVTGELVDADIFFNSTFAWSASSAGDRTKWDLESIALHEIGHLSGLGHSAIGETELTGGGRRVVSSESIMFPIALGIGETSGRTLRPDDIAGISDLYPDGNFNGITGSVSGTVTRNGAGVFGAHIVAFDIVRGEMVANFSLRNDGQFSIAGLQPGAHLLRVEPLDDADIESFFEPDDPVDLGFRVKYYEQLVIVPKGGDSGAVELKVVAK